MIYFIDGEKQRFIREVSELSEDIIKEITPHLVNLGKKKKIPPFTFSYALGIALLKLTSANLNEIHELLDGNEASFLIKSLIESHNHSIKVFLEKYPIYKKTPRDTTTVINEDEYRS